MTEKTSKRFWPTLLREPLSRSHNATAHRLLGNVVDAMIGTERFAPLVPQCLWCGGKRWAECECGLNYPEEECE